MTTYVVAIDLENRDDPTVTTLLYGPFRSYERALAAAAKVGASSGLNRNNFGAWAATDGNDKFAFVHVRKLWPADESHLRDAALRVTGFFANREITEDPQPREKESE